MCNTVAHGHLKDSHIFFFFLSLRVPRLVRNVVYMSSITDSSSIEFYIYIYILYVYRLKIWCFLHTIFAYDHA